MLILLIKTESIQVVGAASLKYQQRH